MSFTLHGLGVSGGIAIGQAQLLSHATLEVAHLTLPARQLETAVIDTLCRQFPQWSYRETVQLQPGGIFTEIR